ncbi:AmmeMemoRadiSam system radical SAM enzyme [Puteibacter caeruleilacunae]|nr:AmmeMemoRadiSam system radical SAM enzyme [Puteibacter caeruleilacunae]
MKTKASYFIEKEGKAVQCILCPHNCILKDGAVGICRVRQNNKGQLETINFGDITALAIDPIEKKPLYHFYPGTQILSVGTNGCNMSCKFCQNHHISQANSNSYFARSFSPEDIIDLAKRQKDNIGIAFTYNEPSIFFEFLIETSKLAKIAGLKNVMISNGYINRKPLLEILETIDAFNIDLKAFNDKFYKKITKSKLQPVLETLKTINAQEKHLEITHLVIPNLNDDPVEFEEMVKWISSELSPWIPLHISRYFPHFEVSYPPTPISTLLSFFEIAKQYLQHVYVGNAQNIEKSDTYCPNCKELLIEREFYNIDTVGLDPNGKCTHCHTPVIKNFKDNENQTASRSRKVLPSQ